MAEANEDLKALIRTIPDFPKPGVAFRDITTLLLDADGFRLTVERLAAGITGAPDLIAGTEARGFIFAAALAHHIGAGLLLIRKDGKLPGKTIAEDYALEYGSDRLAMHVDACAPGARVELVDDLIATGGTALAATRLIRRTGAVLTGASFVIELPQLGGVDLLSAEGVSVRSLIRY